MCMELNRNAHTALGSSQEFSNLGWKKCSVRGWRAGVSSKECGWKGKAAFLKWPPEQLV